MEMRFSEFIPGVFKEEDHDHDYLGNRQDLSIYRPVRTGSMMDELGHDDDITRYHTNTVPPGSIIYSCGTTQSQRDT